TLDDLRWPPDGDGVPVRCTVGALLINEHDEVLLQLRDDKPGLLYPNMWTLFGGAVELDEDCDRAIMRELQEELELTLDLKFWREYVCPVRTRAGEVIVKNNIYIGRLMKAQAELLPLHEGQAKAWFSEASARGLKLAYDQQIVLHAFYDARQRGEIDMAEMTEHHQPQTGLEAIRTMFERAHAEGRAAFLPYFPIGFPSFEESLEAILAMAEVGVDGFEIGIPFSDPLADGPVIQAATQIALEKGTTVRRCLEAVHRLRDRGVKQPLLMMSYINPLLAYGLDAFVRDACDAGSSGLIVPDMPVEEADILLERCQRAGMALVLFLAPTSSPQRIAMVAQRASGFIYVVSLTGITGDRSELPPDLAAFIARVREYARGTPLVLGFGISRPEHVRMVSQWVDGFIVGSALVRAGRQGVPAIKTLAETLHAALRLPDETG
ncbi:MAG: tryptophan synthase subunit alpha, partial [Anaerolinea sp.]|nr:tryptophan synthase subunit alpha [Anaerolinea sp.]